MQASLSPYRPKKNTQLQGAQTEDEQGHTHFPERPTVLALPPIRGWEGRLWAALFPFIWLTECVHLCKEEASVFPASSSAGGKDASNLHEIDGMFLDPLAEWKGCLFWLEWRLCMGGGRRPSLGSTQLPHDPDPLNHTLFFCTQIQKGLLWTASLSC